MKLNDSKKFFSGLKDKSKNIKENFEYKKFKEEFDSKIFKLSLKELINNKFIQKKQETFQKLSDNDVKNNWNFWLTNKEKKSYNYNNKKILDFVISQIDKFYAEDCSKWSDEDGIQYFKFKT